MSPNQPTPADPVPWPPDQTPADLKGLAQALSHLRVSSSATPAHYQRITSLVETAPRKITATRLATAGFLDGVQARSVLARNEHRDLTLTWVAAGTVHNRALTSFEQRLAVVCSARDVGLVRNAGAVPIVELREIHPSNLALATDAWIDQTRQKLEAQVLASTPCPPGQVVVVDGSLPPGCGRDDAIGIVKSALDTTWISDPALFPAIGGWRSPALRLSALCQGESDRLTAFVRLRTATGAHPWGFSLIRVETFDNAGGIDFLDAACALAVSQAQHLGSADPRAECQPAGMYQTELCLKAQIPLALRVLR
ncbi:hypothetical protein EKO23_16360 [Nocardioides guangzhouensis]|uniref:Uncharacterized protein n=1 Tax=Nocardioides guangzhouensis TaxID=2497878 RepID=A0A4Q4Z8T6_9ACTN|nr:hypothetical protein [Nocardioides guangzhouensis]RYP84233.1 hypothetical protein EKO23_16360 [Nocardioides guangzhouensis]